MFRDEKTCLYRPPTNICQQQKARSFQNFQSNRVLHNNHHYTRNTNKQHNNHTCNNCGKYGHSFNQCKMPIISFGLITIRFNKNLQQFEYLMIRRKDSFGFIDFIRGKYQPQNIRQVTQMICQMSLSEKQKILNEPFSHLWRQMWGHVINKNIQCAEEAFAERKFSAIQKGYYYANNLITLNDLIEEDTTTWKETEWEFPKGRREINERDLDCAVREFEEETGIAKKHIQVIENVLPFEEIFIGTNYKCYKNKYFLAICIADINDDDALLNNYQKCEVSMLQWKNYEKCMEDIRPYNIEKKKLLSNIHVFLQENKIFY